MAINVNENGSLRDLTMSLSGGDDDNFSISGIRRLINNKNLASPVLVSNCDPSDYEYIIFINQCNQFSGQYLSISTHIVKGSWIRNATERNSIYLMITRTELSGSSKPNHYLKVYYNLSDNSINISAPVGSSWYDIDVLGLLK
jgi:hypothetical protein